MKQPLGSFLIAFFCVWQSLAFADDTDIYLNTGSNPAAPHLMLMFDYRTDMTATFCSASGGGSCANTLADHPDLLAALEGIVGEGNAADNISAVMAVFQVVFAKFEGIFVGLMMPNDTNGGTILRGYKEFQVDDANGAKAEIVSILQSIPTGGSGEGFFHDVQPKETHYELFRYLNGGAVALGTSTEDNFQGTRTPDFDPDIIDADGNYISPFADPDVDFSCTKLYEVYATSGNAGGNVDDDLDAEIEADMDAEATDPDFDGMVSYMTHNDLVDNVEGEQTLKTWFIQMGTAATRTDDWAAEAGTIDQYMNVGGSNVELADLQTTLEAVFIEALSVSSTFVSAAVPVNVFNRVQTLDNFYIALFEARETERWPGNIKKLKLKDTDADGSFDDIVDVNDLSAFSDVDGRLKFETLTFWTDSDELPPADPDLGEIEGRDGRTVSRGGGGQKIRGFIADDVGLATSDTTRPLYVEPASGSTFDELNADATTAAELQTLLDVATDDDAEALIAWMRGVDVDDLDGDGDSDDVRPWLLGDAIHSRPLAINYGATSGYSESNPNIRLFMGTNDGFFHIFENTTGAGAESGEEVFAFIPRELLAIQQLLRSDTGSNEHPYGVDGEPVALVIDNDNDGTIETGGGDKVHVYVGLRRGGKSYYALDVSDPGATPTLLWKIGKTSGGDFDDLGLTFSTPKVVKVRYENTARDVLIFAGGYDLQKDTDTGAGRDPDSEGNAIYIVDALTGALIWKAVDGATTGTATNTSHVHSDLNHAIPSAVATLDGNANGVVDRLYVGDTSGIVWRVDLPEGSDANHRRDNWTIVKFADVDDAAESEDRRFFHPPDIVQTRDATGNYDGILIESGDRASPLETTDQNFLFLLKDRHITSGSPPNSILDEDELADVTDCESGSEDVCDGLNFGNGWKIELQDPGEKGLSSPLTIAGVVAFTTFVPAGNTACVPSEGTAKLYLVDLGTGEAAFENKRDLEIGPGIPPSVTAIGSDTVLIPGTGITDFDNQESSDKKKLVQTDAQSMYIIYWRETGVDSL